MSYRYWGRATVVMVATVMAGCSAEDAARGDNPLDKYATVRLTTDLSLLTDNERAMIPLLIEAAEPMNDLFWAQAWGDRDSLLSSIEDPQLRRFAEINYGPWDRLAADEPFLPHSGPKPPGANLYPRNMSKEEFDAATDAPPGTADALRSLYTLVRRGPDGGLRAVPYHEAFAAPLKISASKLRDAAALAEEAGLKRYLELRADAILTDEFRESDMAWMAMKDNVLDIVIGPIETYEDKLFGYKAGYEALVLVKDKSWSERLAAYATLLPDLQTGLPVPETYKRETPGTDSDLNAYDVVYYAGEANAGSKSIAVNLPNDESVQLEKGTRRLQLKNSMRAKFDKILVPLANILIAEDQRRHITFNAFFGNTMFHEVAHGLGVKNTINDRGTVREALREHASPMEEGKADILGLYMVTTLFDDAVLTDGSVEDHYVTFLASIFRSVRFGASSAHGRANMARFNFFKEYRAFTRDETSGTYRVDVARMKTAMTALSELILTLQGDGDYEGASAFLEEQGIVTPELQADLDRVGSAGIPVDIVFEQGVAVVGAGSSQR